MGQVAGVEVVYPPALAVAPISDSAGDLPCESYFSVVLARFNYRLSQSGDGTGRRIRVDVIDFLDTEISGQAVDATVAVEVTARTLAEPDHNAHDISPILIESGESVDTRDRSAHQPASKPMPAGPQALAPGNVSANEAILMPPPQTPEESAAVLPEPLPMSPQELQLMDNGMAEPMPFPVPIPWEGLPDNPGQ
jgi:hypothetical protein